MEFYNLTKSALDGTYYETDSVFFRNDRADGYCTRLRAQTHKHNARFCEEDLAYSEPTIPGGQVCCLPLDLTSETTLLYAIFPSYLDPSFSYTTC